MTLSGAGQTDSRRFRPSDREGQRMSLAVRRVSRLVAAPALICMVGGLLAYWLAAGWGVGTSQTPLRGATASLPGPSAAMVWELVGPMWASGEVGAAPKGTGSSTRAMSAGVLALVALPAGVVFLILVNHLRRRRWVEALVALGVLVILAISPLKGIFDFAVGHS